MAPCSSGCLGTRRSAFVALLRERWPEHVGEKRNSSVEEARGYRATVRPMEWRLTELEEKTPRIGELSCPRCSQRGR